MEVPAIRLSRSVRAVLGVLSDRAGVKLSIRDLAKATSLSPATVRNALATLGKARLVQHMTQTTVPDRPPHQVYWITQAGRDIAAG